MGDVLGSVFARVCHVYRCCHELISLERWLLHCQQSWLSRPLPLCTTHGDNLLLKLKLRLASLAFMLRLTRLASNLMRVANGRIRMPQSIATHHGTWLKLVCSRIFGLGFCTYRYIQAVIPTYTLTHNCSHRRMPTHTQRFIRVCVCVRMYVF